VRIVIWAMETTQKKAHLQTEYFSGTSGLVLPVPNKEYYPVEYQDKSRLCYYASLFNTIEINSSFYKIPQARTIEKWTNVVPDDFRFTFKLWRGITHEKRMVFNPADVDRFMNAISAAGTHKACLLVQFPPSAKADLLPQLHQLIEYIQKADPEQEWKLALEFRHNSWYSESLVDFAETQNLSLVLQDIPASATPLNYITNNVVYLRFHGPGGKYRGSYPDDILQEYSSYIREWRADDKTIYVYFNNTMGDAVKNLAALNAFVQQA
jgi:uncharacterized protein YecE (DUF72 family)